MTYQGGEFSTESLFEELKEKAKEEKVQTLGEFKALVDDLVEEKKTYGYFSEDEDTVQIKKTLESRWLEVEKSIGQIERYLG